VADALQLEIAIRRLRAGATLPRYMTPGAAGMDLSAALDAAIEIAPGQRTLVPCGFAIAIPRGYEGQVRPRSGLALKHGLSIPNAPGTIDSDYRGEVCVLVINLGTEPVRIAPGDRVAQLVIAPVVQVELREVDSLEATGRGSGGFGHTA
jgi:dUTP pyrophosphatase